MSERSKKLAHCIRKTKEYQAGGLDNQSELFDRGLAFLRIDLWVVLILGGYITIVSCCLFGTSNFTLHALQVISLTLLLSLSLVALADINRPFQGTVHVQPLGFERARDTFAKLPITSPSY